MKIKVLEQEITLNCKDLDTTLWLLETHQKITLPELEIEFDDGLEDEDIEELLPEEIKFEIEKICPQMGRVWVISDTIDYEEVK